VLFHAIGICAYVRGRRGKRNRQEQDAEEYAKEDEYSV